MPDGKGCPECEKVIINGDIARNNLKKSAADLESICELIERHVDAGREFKDVAKLVLLANGLEDLTDEVQKQVDKFRKEALEQIGFKGPWPKSLQ